MTTIGSQILLAIMTQSKTQIAFTFYSSRCHLKEHGKYFYFQNKPIIQEYAEKLRAEFEQEKKRAVNVATRFDVFKEIDLI